jgi:hypothetical protein
VRARIFADPSFRVLLASSKYVGRGLATLGRAADSPT